MTEIIESKYKINRRERQRQTERDRIDKRKEKRKLHLNLTSNCEAGLTVPIAQMR